MEQNKLIDILKDCEFDTVAVLDVSTLKALPEVRQMCEVNTCGAYNKRWSCPPGCGSIEDCEQKMKKFSYGILVQTVGDIEDSLDWEGIMEVKSLHDKRFINGTKKLREKLSDMLALGDGSCSLCKDCTYPYKPCRFPDIQSASMEAFGLFVSDICRKNNIAYNYGPGKMCYTGCYLFN